MDALANELDKIEEDVQLIPDNSQYKEALIQMLKRLREEFESGITIEETTRLKIAKMRSAVELYVSGTIENPMKNLEVTVPVLSINKDEKEDVAESVIMEKENGDIAILKAYLSKIDYESDMVKIREAIDLITGKYDSLRVYSQEVEQELAGAKYQLMMKFMQNGDYEQAEEYAKAFGTDMRIYIVDRLKKQMQALIDSGRLEEAEKLNAYIYDDAMQENDIALWELVTKIEHPEVEINRTVEENEKEESESILPAVQKKKSIFQIIQDKIAERKYEKEHEIKVFHVRCDPSNAETGINLKDIKRITNFARKNEKSEKMQKFKIVFEEGITAIPRYGFEIEEENDKYRCLKSKQMIGVEFPHTLHSIGDCAFIGSGLEQVDLKYTQLNNISAHCFCGCKSLKRVELPNTIQHIGDSAFAATGIESIDLSATEVEILGASCFHGCKNLKNIRLPNTLKKIASDMIDIFSGEFVGVFENTGLEAIDLSQTQIVEIPHNCFAGCNFLRNVQLPKGIKYICEDAFYGTIVKEKILNQFGEKQEVKSKSKSNKMTINPEEISGDGDEI